MIPILIIIAPLFLIIFAAAIVQRWRRLGDSWISNLNGYALNVGLPVLIFSSLAKTQFSFATEAPLLLANSVFMIGTFCCTLVAGKLLHLKPQMLQTIVLSMMFSNVAYLGIPLLTQFYGMSVLPTTGLVVAVHVFWVFSLGIGYLDYTRRSSGGNILADVGLGLIKNPLFLSVVFGIFVASAGIILPEVFMRSIDMVSASVTPTVLIVIGLFIGKSTIGKVQEWIPVVLFSFVTLIVLPAAFYEGLVLSGYPPSAFTISILQAAMPLAITPFALAEKYGLQQQFIARSIVLSTVFAVISLPFWISLM
jgi:malonate transporter and related proteins